MTTRVSHLSVLLAAGLAIFGLALAPAGAQQHDHDDGSHEGHDHGSADSDEERFVYVKMETSMGDILIELDQEKAPISVENFLGYVEDDYYDDTVFHRVIDGFMIQGGGFNEDGRRKETRDPIENEWKNGLKNNRGTIAMARLGNRPDSATSQFFINLKDNGFLDQPRDGAGYAVFGQVADGMDVVDKIAKVRTGTRRGMQNWPVENVVIENVQRVEEGKGKGG